MERTMRPPKLKMTELAAIRKMARCLDLSSLRDGAGKGACVSGGLSIVN